MTKFDAAIFDLDGTLLDTAEGVTGSIRYVIETLGLAPLSEEMLRSFIGPPIQNSFARIYGFDKERAAHAAAIFRERYSRDGLLRAGVYDGIKDTIVKLKEAGIGCAVATYKRQDYTDRLLGHFGFDRICDRICGSDPEGKLTKRDIIENAIRSLGISDYSRAVMIGDSDNDALGAAAINVPFIAVTYGFGFLTKSDAAKFDNVGIADSPEDILRIIL